MVGWTTKRTFQKEVPDELVARLNDWRRATPKATLTEIEEAVETELAKIRNVLVTALAQAGEESQQNAPNYIRCGQAMVRNGCRKRRLKSKEALTMQLERQQWRCLECGTTVFPLDEALGFLGGAYTPQIRKLAIRLGRNRSSNH